MKNIRKHEIYFDSRGLTLQDLKRSDIPQSWRQDVGALPRSTFRLYSRLPIFVFGWATFAGIALSSAPFAVRILAVVIQAFCMTGLLGYMHDAVHGTLSPSRRVNHIIGFCCAAPSFLSFSAYSWLHLQHHAYERSSRDPDDMENHAGILGFRTLQVIMLFGGGFIYLVHVAWTSILRADSPTRKKILAEYAILLISGTGIVALFGIQTIVWIWWAPFLVTSLLSHIRFLAEHTLTTPGHILTLGRTVVSNRFVSFFLLNLNYHVEHHVFPGAPWYQLPKIHSRLKPHYSLAKASIYGSYSRFFLDWMKSLKYSNSGGKRLIPQEYIDGILSSKEAAR